MAKRTKITKFGNIKIKFSGDPPAPPAPPSHESDVIVAKFEASLQPERATRIVALIVTSSEIVARYRRTESRLVGTIVDATHLGARATAKDVLTLLRSPHSRLGLRRIVDAERGMSEFEPLAEAKMLAGGIYYHSTWGS
ncbi:hypothetical protein [Rhizobium sp. 2MFCol3.1]|uniref:hypothetical protein n=1 Tax=Rhizobium sp. 2MFCol3.1 TaxID=1246459 RepID=UPI0012DFE518|nr:hypothetical protein [Rhizobium sp. 2MFCol3.1]